MRNESDFSKRIARTLASRYSANPWIDSKGSNRSIAKAVCSAMGQLWIFRAADTLWIDIGFGEPLLTSNSKI
jgi:hypothetical protein